MMDYRRLARYAYFGMLDEIANRQKRLLEDMARFEAFGKDAVPANPMFYRLDTLSPLLEKNPREDFAKRRAELDALTEEARELGKLLVTDNEATWEAAIRDMMQRHGLKPKG